MTEINLDQKQKNWDKRGTMRQLGSTRDNDTNRSNFGQTATETNPGQGEGWDQLGTRRQLVPTWDDETTLANLAQGDTRDQPKIGKQLGLT
jgi:hypothetical protein